MIFDDSLEYDGFFPANGAELISMKKFHDIKLSDIWIPSNLLPNRDLPLRLNLNKPILYHTLEKPKQIIDSLSVYSEADTTAEVFHCNSEKLLDSLEDISYDKRREEYDELIDEDWPSSFNYESETAKVIEEDCPNIFNNECETTTVIEQDCPKRFNNECETTTVIDEDYPNSSDYECETTTVLDKDCLSKFNDESNSNQEIFKSDENSFADLLEHLCLSDSDTEDQAIESKPDLLSKDCVGNQEHNLNELSNSDIKNTGSAEIINKKNEYTEKSTLLCNSNNNKDLNCERFSKISVNDELINECTLNKFASYSNLNNLNENKLIFENISESASNSKVLHQNHEAILNIASISNNSNILYSGDDDVSKAESICDKSPLKPVFLHQNNNYDNVLTESAQKKEISFDSKQIETDKLTFASESEGDSARAEPVNSYSILYQKSKDEEVVPDNVCTNRRKVKKDKKPKKKTSNYIALCNFFLSESEVKGNQSDVPDYLHYLMEKENSCAPIPVEPICHLSSSDTVFPTLPEKSDSKNDELFGKIEEDEAEDVRMSLKMVTRLLKESSCSVTEKTVTPEEVNKNQIKLIIENIPLGVDNETVESILLTYGDVTRLTLRRQGIYLKADVKICLHPHIEDPEWIIDCLNGSQPFGVFSGAELKCYLRK